MNSALSLAVVRLSDLYRAGVAFHLPTVLSSIQEVIQAALRDSDVDQEWFTVDLSGIDAGTFIENAVQSDGVLPDASRGEVATAFQGDGPWAVLELEILSSADFGHAAFHPPTHTLFRINERTASVLATWMESNGNIDRVAEQHRVAIDEVKALVAQIHRDVQSRPLLRDMTQEAGALRRLVLNVSHDCNMRCQYCYADGGHYGRPRDLMRPEVAWQAIDWVYGRYRRVENVMFFGGEPTMNPAVIRACCERTLALYRQGVVSHWPLWGMVTNGLALDQEMEDVIRRYDLVVTVSLDGPPEIHDSLRQTRDGRDSFQRIARVIRRLQEITHGREPSRIEATYTSAHQRAGLGITELASYFDQAFGIHDIHVAPVATRCGHHCQWELGAEDAGMVRDAAADVVTSWLTERPKQMLSVAECLHPIVTDQCLSSLCGCGSTDLTVLANGDVYPCHLLLIDDYRIGNVADPGSIEERLPVIQQRLRDHAKAKLHQCSRCWVRNICRACLGAAWVEHQTLDRIPDRVCTVNRAVAESALLALAYLHSNPASWDRLCANVARMMSSNMARHSLHSPPA